MCVCVCVKAAHTHTRRGGDGVRPGDVRLPVVQADENFHGPAKEKEEKEKSTTPLNTGATVTFQVWLHRRVGCSSLSSTQE